MFIGGYLWILLPLFKRPTFWDIIKWEKLFTAMLMMFFLEEHNGKERKSKAKV